ncbi:(2Fe-2S)-binding protein [Streptomyces sp. NBC_00094]|uniref:(2Fe-2S)-binding protein n=1 Tax=Streptomyces sp. NBC_00094 TaxID=2903620 RepID=UPI0022533960|nr:(2Fe-2S)-binding protein [Streptomyces sp. NBC_00094]MCX5390991.1 (2Fe-2S)-binding protein [Streptomyces sp. NBC_00094]
MSTDEQHGNPGGWEPIPQSEGYDGDATAFVQLPPDFMLDGVPLEAPGHGYVPPMITPLQPLTPAAATDPAATGSWTVHLPTEAEHVQYFDQVEQAEPAERVEYADHTDHAERVEYGGNFGQDPHATAEWNFAGGGTGQWEIPAAPDAVEPALPPSYAEAPATLPGGAPAPWALPEEPETAPEAAAEEPEAEGEPAAPDAPEDTVEAPDDVPGAEDALPAPSATTTEAHGNGYASTDSDEHPHTSYTLRVNGTDRPVTGSWIGESLLYVLRERLGLAGAKDGCSQGECGACNVKVDGRLVASCLVPAATAAGSEVRTVEGLATDGEPSDVQRAMAKCGTVQCGFCIPGMCMTVHDLLEGNHAPTELETRQALAGNLCRCSGYRGVLEAVRDVVAEREASAAAAAPTQPEAAGEARVPHRIPHPHDGGMA